MAAGFTSQETQRRQKDALKTGNCVGPNAANTVNTNAISLETGNGATFFPTNGDVEVHLSSTIGTGANSKNINYALQHTNSNSDGTADNGNWVNIPELAIQVVAGNTTNTGALNTYVTLPPSTKPWIRGTATGEANGGASTDLVFTVDLLF